MSFRFNLISRLSRSDRCDVDDQYFAIESNRTSSPRRRSVFREFVMALSAASVVNRVRLVETLFHVFDLDSDGKITKEEIGKMLHTLVDVTDSNDKRRKGKDHRTANQTDPNKQVNIQRRIDDAFNELNANDDDYITKEEFIEWYMKSGLISEVQTNEVDIQETSRLQQKEKKSRKSKKLLTNLRSNQEQDENRNHLPYLVRHISRMTERKSPVPDLDDDDDDNSGRREAMDSRAQPGGNDPHRRNTPVDVNRRTANPIIRVTTSSEDGDPQHSKENERWQHLFHSVLGQIRTQDSNEQVSEATTQPRHYNGFNRKKRNDDDGDDSVEMKRMPQSPDAQYARPNSSTRDDRSARSLPPPPSRTLPVAYDIDDDDDDDPTSPDVLSIRL